MPPTPERAVVRIGKFDPARVFPPGDKLTYPLLRLMMATDDARCASLLFAMADRQERDTSGAESVLHAGRMWYLCRLLCSHLSEAGHALATLLGSVPRDRLGKLLGGGPGAVDELERLRAALGEGSPARKVRDAIGSHYWQAGLSRVYEADLAAGRVDGSLIACDEVGALTRFTITDVLALRMMDDAFGAATREEFSARVGEVVALSERLSTAVVHLLAALLTERGVVQAPVETVEVPPLFRAAVDWAERELSTGGEAGSNPDPGS